MKKLALLLLMIFCSTLFGAASTMYVCTTSGISGSYNYLANGNDSAPGNGTLAHPYATINKAIFNHTSGVGDTVTVICKAGDTLAACVINLNNASAMNEGINFITRSSIPGTRYYQSPLSSSYYCSVSNCISGNIKFVDMYFYGTTSDVFKYEYGKSMNIGWSNCVFDSNGMFFEDEGAGDPNFKKITSESSVIKDTSHVFSFVDIGDVNILNSTMSTSNINGDILLYQNTGKNLTVKNSTLAGGAAGINIPAGKCRGKITLLNDLISGDTALELVDDINQLTIDNVYVTGATLAARLGQYDKSLVHGIKNCRITNSKFISPTGAAMDIEFGLDKCLISNNTFKGNSNHTFQFGSSNMRICSNLVIGPAPTGFDWGRANDVQSNTFINTGATGAAFLTGKPGGASYASYYYAFGGSFCNNICYTSGANTYAFWDYEGNGGSGEARGVSDGNYVDSNGTTVRPYDYFNMHVRNNCYFNANSATNVIDINNIAYGTIAGARAMYTAWNKRGDGSRTDIGSIIADPKFKNVAAGDYNLAADSPCLKAGIDGSSMGAQQVNSQRYWIPLDENDTNLDVYIFDSNCDCYTIGKFIGKDTVQATKATWQYTQANPNLDFRITAKSNGVNGNNWTCKVTNLSSITNHPRIWIGYPAPNDINIVGKFQIGGPFSPNDIKIVWDSCSIGGVPITTLIGDINCYNPLSTGKIVAAKAKSNFTGGISAGDVNTTTSARSVAGYKAGERALRFNGTTDYVNTGQTFQSTFQSSFTISFWAKPTDGMPDTSNQVFVGQAGGNIFQVYLDGTGKIGLEYEVIDPCQINILTNNACFTNNQQNWHFITVAIEKIGTSNRGKIYFDGILAGDSGATANLVNMESYGGLNIFVGAKNGESTPTQYFNGAMDDVRIYNRALSAKEIKKLASKNSGGSGGFDWWGWQ
jgi:hypothetical protein